MQHQLNLKTEKGWLGSQTLVISSTNHKTAALPSQHHTNALQQQHAWQACRATDPGFVKSILFLFFIQSLLSTAQAATACHFELQFTTLFTEQASKYSEQHKQQEDPTPQPQQQEDATNSHG
jgi:hypothetical protein